MKNLAILGLGHIGDYVFNTLSNDLTFASVVGYDLKLGHDLQDEALLRRIIEKCDGVLASTPFFLNKKIAKVCFELNKDYFDLTESIEVTDYVSKLSKQQSCKSRFVTQCGLAPGMVSIIAQNLASQFQTIHDIEIRVGALPQNPTNSLGYYRTWNTEGLINEYIHPCPAIVDGQMKLLEPVDNLTNITFDGEALEAANTSGGIGSLPLSYLGKAKNIVYQTLRYPGHWQRIRFLKDEMGLKENFNTYVQIFNKNIPITQQDVIYILINVTGIMPDGSKTVKQYQKKIMHTDSVTAIQLSTAGGVMAVLDSWNQGYLNDKYGWILQENLDFTSVWNSRYSESYK